MRQLLTAPASAGLLAEGIRFLKRHRSQEVLLLGATRTAVDDLVRMVAGGVAGVRRYTLPQYVAELTTARLAERGAAPLNRLGAEALAARAIHLVRTRDGLEYFAPLATSPGFARALARTLRDLRMARVTADRLPTLGPAGRDLSALQRQYEQLLAETRLADFAALLELACQSLLEQQPAPVLLLDLPLWEALPTQLLTLLCQRAPEALALLLAGDERSLANYQRFLLPAALPAGAAEAPDALNRLRANLFATQPPPAAPPDPSVQFFSAAGEGLECTEIARRLQQLAARGLPFDRTAILLRDPNRYQPLLEEALSRAGIPCHFTHGSVRPDPAGRAFLALLYFAAEDFPATRFAEYLSLGQAPVAGVSGRLASAADRFGAEDDLLPPAVLPEPAPNTPFAPAPAIPAAWEQLLIDAAVIGGRERWARRLQGLEEEFRLRLRKLDAGGEPLRLHLERQLDQLVSLTQLALPAIEQLAALPRSASWREWLSALTALAESTLRSPDSVILALNELWAMGDAGPVGLEEVILVLEERLRFLRRPPASGRYGKVWAGSIEEARGLSFDTVFLPGLAEGLFPRRAFEDPLLLDAQRVTLDPQLPFREDRAAAERLLLRIAAAAAATTFVASYPRVDVARNRQRVPSFYAVEVIRAAEGALPELKSLERRAAAQAETRLGWPFPVQTALAIDDLEFDLAMLHRALEAGSGEAKGLANYLFHLNSHVGRSLRTRYLRWLPKWSTADGLINPDPAAKAILAHYRLRDRPWSASSLQLLAACPYRFLLHGIHRLRPREELAPLVQIDPLTRGALFHEVQFRLFRRTPEWRQYSAIADEVLDAVAAEYRERLAPAIPRVWYAEMEDLRADLHGWLRRLPEDAAGWRVRHSEYAFGLPGGAERDPASSASPASVFDGILLRGSVDWIEEHLESGVLRITDHKTGKTPQQLPAQTGGGRHLQPLLYAVAVENLFGREVQASRLYFCTQRGRYQTVAIPQDGAARETLWRALHQIDEMIAGGALPAAPAEGECEWCDYRLVCGPREEERIRRKPKLALLEELRLLP